MHEPPSHLTLRLPGGKTVELAVDAARPIVVGRDPACDVVADDPSVSGRHAELRVVPGGIGLRDLGSRFGTHVGEHAVDTAVLGPGDTAWLGDVALVVPAAAPAAGVARAPTPATVAGPPVARDAPPPAPAAPRRPAQPIDRFVVFAIAIAVVVLVAVAALFLLG